MLKVRLPNWGRWGRHDPDKPNSQQVGSSICVKMLRPAGSPDVWDGPQDLPPPPIDFRDADNLDGFVLQLGKPYRERICRVFYKQEDIRNIGGMDNLYESVRMLLDLTDANRATVDKMYALISRGQHVGA